MVYVRGENMLNKVFKTYGRAILTSVVVIALIIILNTISYTKNGVTYTGIFQITGKAASIENNSFKPESEAVKDYLESPRPEIVYDPSGLSSIKKAEIIAILNYFKVKFSDQETFVNANALDPQTLEVKDITAASGDSCLALYNSSNKTICFSSSGIYTFTFHVIHNQKETTVKIKIPVN
jgi:hypothetical protein